jgi:hypothetical protein
MDGPESGTGEWTMPTELVGDGGSGGRSAGAPVDLSSPVPTRCGGIGRRSGGGAGSIKRHGLWREDDSDSVWKVLF